jgi:hypothetical protein
MQEYVLVKKPRKPRAKKQRGGNPAAALAMLNTAQKLKPISKLEALSKNIGLRDAVRKGLKSKNKNIRNLSAVGKVAGQVISQVGKAFGLGTPVYMASSRRAIKL